MKIQCRIWISKLIQLFPSKLLFAKPMQLLLRVFLLQPYILQCRLTNTLHQSPRFCYEADAYLYRIRKLLQIPPKYLFLVAFSYLPNSFSPLFYYIFSFIFVFSCPLEYSLVLLTCSSCTNHILLDQVQMDQNLFLLSANSNVLEQSIFFVFFSQLVSVFHQLILAHFSSFLKFSSFLHQGQF